MINYYGYGYRRNGNNHSLYYRYDLIFENIVTEFYLNAAPIFIGFSNVGSDNIGHAVTGQGYVELSNGYRTLSYMDPADGTYKAAYIPSNGDMTIVVGGITRHVSGGFAVYD